MKTLTSIEYDDCRNWIKRRHSKGANWDELRMACKSTETELVQFLNSRIEEDEWPKELDACTWRSLVAGMEESELKMLQLQKANRMAELHDGRAENNKVFVPEDEFSCWQLYKKHLKEDQGFSDEAIQNIEDASINILKRLSFTTKKTEPIKGLVIGNVQSGKTANMAGLMAMAADWRWNMFIVLSGTIESLRKQTQTRLHNDLHNSGNLVWTQLDHLSKKHSPIGQRLCDLQLQPESTMRYMTVCLKVKSRLEDLIEWIEADQTNIQNLRILVIDDEADQAGINTGDVYTETERKTINRLILNLVHCRNKKANSDANNTYESHYQSMNYISYTATPYANCLNEQGPETLYPSSFIRTLNISRSYFGPSRFFGGTDADRDGQLDIVRNVSPEDVTKVKAIHERGCGDLPATLKEALEWFMCSAAMMRFYNYKKPISMLIHTSQRQADHKAIAKSVKQWLTSDKKEIIDGCRNRYSIETKRFTKRDLRNMYPEYEYSDEQILDYPAFYKIENSIYELISEVTSIMMDDEGELHYSKGINLCIDNCANSKTTNEGMHLRLAYPDPNSASKPNYSTVFIVVGGNTLSRGLTLEGLVSSFFLRSVKQADTLMQMARWFGYRTPYELLQRVWMTSDTRSKFGFLSELDSDLREQIYQMQLAGKSPDDFCLAFITSPKANWLSLTSKNKMHMAAPALIDFSGTDTQLTVYSKDVVQQKKNLSITESFIDSLGQYRESEYTTAFVWDNIPFQFISDNFFSMGFSIPETSRAFQQIDLLEEWIQKRTEKGELQNWNVVLCGVKIKDSQDDEKIWKHSNGIKIGKVNRSCKNESDDHISIGVLSTKRDYLSDIKRDQLSKIKWNEMLKDTNIINNYKEYREIAGVGKIPLFLIYIIDRNSQPSSRDRQERSALNVDCDLIGITMVIPGVRGSGGLVTRIKIKQLAMSKEAEVN